MEPLSADEGMTRWDEIISSGGECTHEEYSLLRRMVAASLAQSVGGEQISHPLSLVDPTLELSDSVELTGAQLEYVDTIKRYSEGHASFVQIMEHQRILSQKAQEQKEADEKEKALDQEIMEIHLQVAKLQKDHDQRRAVMKYLSELEKLPAAQPDFLDPAVIYKDCSPMPDMPKQMIDGFATDYSATDAKAEELLQTLKKHVLRSKLVAQRQQTDYEQSRIGSSIDLQGQSPEAKLYALNSVKNALIAWIETQLARAGDDGPDIDSDETPAGSEPEFDHEAMMADIQQKYQRHIELRQGALNQLAQMDRIKERLEAVVTETNITPTVQRESEFEATPKPDYTPEAYLLIPYIEQMQTLARRQKSMIQEKSHINSSLAKQQADARQVLDRLAEESQLLARYPVAKEPSKSQSPFEDVAGMMDKVGIAEKVRPWIYAADSAKLATLEEVAEDVVVGMESVDEARAHLEQVCKLLNVPSPREGEETTQKDPVEDAEESLISPRKGQAKKEDGPMKTIWDILDGNLGSINE